MCAANTTKLWVDHFRSNRAAPISTGLGGIPLTDFADALGREISTIPESSEVDTHGGDPARPSTLAATATEELAAPPSALLAAPASGEAGVGDEVADTDLATRVDRGVQGASASAQCLRSIVAEAQFVIQKPGARKRGRPPLSKEEREIRAQIKMKVKSQKNASRPKTDYVFRRQQQKPDCISLENSEASSMVQQSSQNTRRFAK